jgi:choline kinase
VNILFLLAGRGKRLGEMTKKIPKPLVDVNGRSIILRSLEKLTKFKVNKIFIVVGYRYKKIISEVGKKYNGIEIVYIRNSIWMRTNNMYSLYLAKNILLNDDVLIVEGDVLFTEKTVKKIFDCKYDNFVVVSPWKKGMDGGRLIVNSLNEVEDWSISRNGELGGKSTFKSVGIFKSHLTFSQNYFVPALVHYSKQAKARRNMYYDDILSKLVLKNFGMIKALNIGKSKWIEIDNKNDYLKALKMFDTV